MDTLTQDGGVRLPNGQVTPYRKLNVGCGFDIRPGYLNVDLNDFHSPDIVADIIDLKGFPSNTFEEIVAKDVLEHFLWADTPKALLEWNRVLAPGGRLFLATTWLTGLAQRILHPSFADLEFQRLTIVNLFSMQKYPGDFHYTAFTERLLRYHMWAAGFEVESLEIFGGWIIQGWFVKRRDYSGEDLRDIQGDEAFVGAVYRALLEREADPGGMAGKIEALAAGADRMDIYKGVILSEERTELMARKCPQFELQFDPY